MCGTERERQMSLVYFFHDHPLTLHYFEAYADLYHTTRGRSIILHCMGCGEGILGFGYICMRCGFYIHKSCGELPRELWQYPLHPQHPLILTTTIPHPLERCYFCNKYMVVGYSYNCSDHCNFNIHLKCASILFTIKAEFHNHPLNLLRISVSFTCDACGIKDEDKSYLCLTCPLMVHLKCATLPLTLKHISHHHALNLTDSSQLNQSHLPICRLKHISHHHALNLTESSQLNQSHLPICRLCVKKVETTRVYYCSVSKCNFAAHLDCATREGDTEEIKQPLESTGMLEKEDSEPDESNHSLSYVVKKNKIGEDKIEIAEEIEHFSHEHDLKLTKEELHSDEKCDGCMHPIFPHPFYSCAQCRFFLHKSCVELPKKKRQSFHPHLLTLFARTPYANYRSFICNVCRRHCNGFAYHCKECLFDADVQCSLISDIFTHDGHEHPLILPRAPYDDKCSCCDNEGKVFRCTDCEFTLDLRCATLPRMVRYRYFEHPFKLCYDAENDYDGECYCDICEKERNPKHWFYYSADLNFPAHPFCILGEFPYVKNLAPTTSLG